ncbi:MAG: fibrobacter succinogenes major paralogous domain-containing protein, partial [Bacteroidota bacterium]
SNSYSDDINSSGWIGGMVPKNKALQLTVNRICSGAKIILYDTLIGPFATNLNLDSILVNTSQLVLTRISGSITDCNNNLIKASYVMINGNDIIYANNGFYSTVVCDNSVVINAGFPVQTSSTQLINLNGSSQVVNFQICPQFNTGTMSDFDGNLYKTITIGNQTWMAENLRTEHFKLGGHIATSLNNYNWNTTTAPAYTSWNNDTTGDYVYGKLYNWYAVIDSSGLCPVGWRVPNDSDWTVLIDGLGGNFIAGGFLKEAGYSHWDYPNVGANNISGFNALPSGVRNDAGTYAGRQSLSLWWSTSERAVKTSKDNVETDLSAWDRRWGMSVRCIKN